MELLPKWKLTGTLPAFSDDDSSTVIEMTYKLYQTMQTLITEYNSFADSVNSKILGFPWITIGSIANVIPGSSLIPFPAFP